MAIGTLFVLPAAAHPSCRGSVFYSAQFFFMLNFLIPILLLTPAVLCFFFGDLEGVKRLTGHAWETVVDSYRIAPSATIFVVALVLWTFYCTTMRYQWRYGDVNPGNPDDLRTFTVVTDRLTGNVDRRVFTFDECYQEVIDEQNSNR